MVDPPAGGSLHRSVDHLLSRDSPDRDTKSRIIIEGVILNREIRFQKRTVISVTPFLTDHSIQKWTSCP